MIPVGHSLRKCVNGIENEIKSIPVMVEFLSVAT
jgi:hypothetical protein